MREILTSLNETVASFVQSIKDTASALYAKSNQRKEELATAIRNMQEASDCLYCFSEALAPLNEIAEIGDIAEEAAEYVAEMAEDMYVFEAPVEEFDGYCSNCGDELLRSTPLFVNEADDYICEDCNADLYDTEDEAEEVEEEEEAEDELPFAEQLAFPFADSPCAHD